MANPPQPNVVTSAAISRGADLIMSLIENEKEKAAAAVRQELMSQLEQFSGVSAADIARRCQDAELASKTSQEALEKAREEVLAARNEAEKTKTDLARVVTVLGRVGIVLGPDDTIQLQEKWAAILAGEDIDGGATGAISHGDDPGSGTVTRMGHKPSLSSVDPIQILGNLRSAVERRRAEVVHWREKYHALKKERDQLKEALEAKNAGSTTQMPSLTAAVKNIQESIDATQSHPTSQCAPVSLPCSVTTLPQQSPPDISSNPDADPEIQQSTTTDGDSAGKIIPPPIPQVMTSDSQPSSAPSDHLSPKHGSLEPPMARVNAEVDNVDES